MHQEDSGQAVAPPASEETGSPRDTRCGFRLRIRVFSLLAAAAAIGLFGWRLYSRLSVEDPMHTAAARGDIVTLHTMLLLGYTPDAQRTAWTYCKNTPLYAAVSERKLNAARVLLRYGATVDFIGHNELTPLFYANESRMVKLLLENGADPYHRGLEGYTACHYFARFTSDPEIFINLARNGVDINLKSELGTTPLHEAMVYGDSSVIETLLDLGADVNSRSNLGETPLHYAAYTSEYSGIPSPPSMAFTTAFFESPGKQNSIQALLDRGANPEAVDKRGLTPAEFEKDAVDRATKFQIESELLFDSIQKELRGRGP